MVGMKRQPDLLEVVGATHAIGRFTYFLNCRDQQSDQNCNNGNDHKQFNQCETVTDRSTHAIGLITHLHIGSLEVYFFSSGLCGHDCETVCFV
jgi:hypothetical protein